MSEVLLNKIQLQLIIGVGVGVGVNVGVGVGVKHVYCWIISHPNESINLTITWENYK